ncbi:HlyD family type I secretion periplasmic adaptor subunit [Hyphomicrobium album]|uniref:HlyD family type I secretion periplasmic adaptor subunit n=1 Tax=Hyphomicrobium album TaxID=2665159 RepID=UPI0018A93B2C|nr:HlyD family type I secretion periplasmic adaptor subunit [Hyphomicrobium album]
MAVAPAETPDWLTSPIEFEDQASTRTRRHTMRIVVLLVAVALVWAAVAPIREHSKAQGQLVPRFEVRPVQHLEGGIVDQILVSEGDLVEKGQPLLRLRPIETQSDLAGLHVRANNLTLQKARSEALLAGREMQPGSLKGIGADIVAEHNQVLRLRVAQRAKERELLASRVDQRKAEIAGLKSQIPMQQRLVEMQKERLDGRQQLFAQGAMSKKQVLEVETLYEQARIQLRESERKLAMAEEALPEAAAALDEAEAQARKLWSEELTKASSELAEIQETVRKQTDRVDRLEVRSPIRGRVQNLLQRSPGEVVPPGESILRVVPVGGDLVAEVRVHPEDIADVKVGDAADIKVSAFDFSRYGKLKGAVTSISPTTFETEDDQLYYKALIKFDPADATNFKPFARLQPGMTIDADIISGSKSLLRYLLKPIFRGMDVAFSER